MAFKTNDYTAHLKLATATELDWLEPAYAVKHRTEEEARQRGRLALLNRRNQIGGGLLAHALQSGERCDRQPKQIRCAMHHMYAAVPCYNLHKLHDLIKHDLPPSSVGLIATWHEIITILRKQKDDPAYQYIPKLPEQSGAYGD